MCDYRRNPEDGFAIIEGKGGLSIRFSQWKVFGQVSCFGPTSLSESPAGEQGRRALRIVSKRTKNDSERLSRADNSQAYRFRRIFHMTNCS